MNINPPTEHQLLVFWVALFALLVTARLLGAVARRVGQPAVVGELAAGLLLGPSVLGRVLPDVSDWLFPADDVQTGMIFTVGWIGVVFLLVATGYETDLALIRRLGRVAGVVAAGSLIIPILAGFAVGSTMPSVFLGENGDATIFALFIAAALSISSLPVIAKILGDMGFMRRNFGQLTLAAGMVNDVVGWILLGVIAGLAQAGSIELGALVTTIAGVAVFFALAMTVGQRFVDIGSRRVRGNSTDPTGGLAFIVVVALALGAITQALGVEAVLGAFVAGVLFSRSPSKDDHAMHRLEYITGAFLAPVFFATAGLQVDLGLLADGEVLFWALIVIAVASLSKFFGAVIGGRIVGLANREGAALGIGLNARGALEIVIATVGLSLEVLNQTSYTIIVLMAVATSMMAPPMLRAVLAGWSGTTEEIERLEREEAMRTNIVVRDRRVLLPTRGGTNSIIAAQVLDLAWPEGVPATLLTLQDGGDAPDVRPLRNVFADRAVEHRLVSGPDTAEAILAEAKLGYGAIGIGATDHPAEGHLLSPIADELLRRAEVPVTVVRRSRASDRPLPWAFSRAVVPITGSDVSKAAEEVAYNISKRLGTEIVLVHMVRNEDGTDTRGPGRTDAPAGGEREGGGMDPEGLANVLARNRPSQNEVADRLLSHAAERGENAGARVVTEVRSGDTGPAVVRFIEEQSADLVVLGVNRRPHSEQLFLGHTIEHILTHCDTTIVLVAVPTESRDAT